MKKRAQSNKALKRKIIGGRTEVEDKKRVLAEQLKQEDEERRMQAMANSPSRKPNEKVVSGI